MHQFTLHDSMDNPIHLYLYKTKQPAKGIIHIIHGASEHFARYGLFCEYLNEHGYHVIGSDILGHGLSTDTNDYVHFADHNGDELALESVFLVKDYIKNYFPELDTYLLGHSMGSFIARKMLIDDDEGFYHKAIFSGTTYMSPALLSIMKCIVKFVIFFHSPRYVSPFVLSLGIDSNIKKMRKDGLIGDTDEEWLTKDEAIQTYYHDSPMCGQPFTVGAYKDMLNWLKYINKKKNIAKGQKHIPIFFASGEKDPLSDYGAKIHKICRLYQNLGYEKIQSKLYKNNRHEILNETNKEQVYDDFLEFFENA